MNKVEMFNLVCTFGLCSPSASIQVFARVLNGFPWQPTDLFSTNIREEDRLWDHPRRILLSGFQACEPEIKKTHKMHNLKQF